MRPSNLQAHKIGEIARTIDFDWKNIKDVLAQFNDEVRESTRSYQNRLN